MEKKNTLLAIFTCADHVGKLAAQQATWIPEMIMKGYGVEVFNGDRLGVEDSRAGLCQKTRAICRWAVDSPYDYLVKIDDDVHVHSGRFIERTEDYAGHLITAPPGHTNFAFGFLYHLSRRAFTVLAAAEIPKGLTWEEDQWVGDNLARHGVYLTDLPGQLSPWYCLGPSPYRANHALVALGQQQTPHDIHRVHRLRGDQ